MMIEIFDSVDLLIEASAENWISKAIAAVNQRGRFVVALSGGSSPIPLYNKLAQAPYAEKIPWDKTFVLWSDERYVPLDNDQSNAGNAIKQLLQYVPIPKENIYPIYQVYMTPVEAAEHYEVEMKNLLLDKMPRIDLTMLGCGEDSHTASLFPNSNMLFENKSLVSPVYLPDNQNARVTLTPYMLNLSRSVFFLAYGENKAEAVSNVIEGVEQPDKYPAQLINPIDGEITWYLDKQAGRKLTKYTSVNHS